MKRLLALAFVLSLAACSKSPAAPIVNVPPDFGKTTSVAFTGGTVTAKIAATAAARDTGLMYVTALAADAGMLFVFGVDHSAPDGFWMLNTPLPLSVAFIDAGKVVINIDDMAPNTTTPHYSTRPYRYALEVNQGWFATHGVTAGTAVTFSLPAGTVIDP